MWLVVATFGILSHFYHQGVSPSIGAVGAAAAMGAAARPPVPVFVLIRPRAGDFCYSAVELDAMVRDIAATKAAGARGVVIGCLTPSREVDMVACRRLVQAARNEGLGVTFSRAVDMCRDSVRAFAQCVALEVDTVLTSGGGQRCDGQQALAKLREMVSAGGAVVMAGSGVSPENAAAVVRATGVRILHGSLSAPVGDDGGLGMGQVYACNFKKVVAIRAALGR